MLQAGARFCKCLGTEFLPYLPLVMPQLLQSASLSPDVTVQDKDDDGDDVEEDDDEDEEVKIVLWCSCGMVMHVSASIAYR